MWQLPYEGSSVQRLGIRFGRRAYFCIPLQDRAPFASLWGVPRPPKEPKIMALYPKIESIGSTGSIILAILEVQVAVDTQVKGRRLAELLSLPAFATPQCWCLGQLEEENYQGGTLHKPYVPGIYPKTIPLWALYSPSVDSPLIRIFSSLQDEPLHSAQQMQNPRRNHL